MNDYLIENDSGNRTEDKILSIDLILCSRIPSL